MPRQKRLTIQFLVSLIAGPFWVLANSEAIELKHATLHEVVDAVMERHPLRKSLQFQTEAALAAHSHIKRSHWPTLSAYTQWTRGDEPVYVFGSLLDQGRLETRHFDPNFLNSPNALTHFRSALELQIPVFTAFTLTHRQQQAQWNTEKSMAVRTHLEQSIRMQTAQLAIQWIFQQHYLRQIQERIKTASTSLESAEQLKRSGVVLGSDYWAAQAIFSSLRAKEEQCKRDLQQIQFQLQTLQASGDSVLVPTGTLHEWIAEIPSMEKSLQTALMERNDLKELQLQEKIDRLEVQIQSNQKIPTAQAFGSFQTDTHSFQTNPTHHLAGIRANWVFADPTYSSKRQQAIATHKAREASLLELEDAIHINISNTWMKLSTAQERLRWLKASADQAQQALDQFRPLYRQGRQSVLDVLRAESDFLQASTLYEQALYELHIAYLELQHNQGTLTEKTLIYMEKSIR